MLERFKELAAKLRKAEEEVDGDYKNFFADRALQVESWVRILERGGILDTAYACECARGFEELVS